MFLDEFFSNLDESVPNPGTVLTGTHNLVDTDPRAGTGSFPTQQALVFPIIHSNPDGHSCTDTVNNDLMHRQYAGGGRPLGFHQGKEGFQPSFLPL